MKNKALSIIACILIAVILSGVACLKIWGGEPQFENFGEVKTEYEILAELASEAYNEISAEKEHVIFDLYDGAYLMYEDEQIHLNDEQKTAVALINEDFDYLRVCKDAVFFHEDETGYYGLVYSKHPIIALYKNEIPQRGRDYHRLSDCWYEWGVFGL